MMKRKKMEQRVGEVYGKLTVNSVYREGKRSYAECLCSCGNLLITRIDAIQSGATVSCGCYNKEMSSKTHKTHGMQETGSYASWESMKQRCFNKNHGGYEVYKHIPVCEKWLDFEGFYEDMGDRPDGLTLDRIDVTKGYCKENCRWATASYQAKNQSKRNKENTYSKYKGVGKDFRQKSGKVWFFSVTKNYKTFRKCCHSEEQAAAYFNYCTKLLYEDDVYLNDVDYELSHQEKLLLDSLISEKFKE